MIDIKFTEDNFIKKKSNLDEINNELYQNICNLINDNWSEIKITKIYEVDKRNNILDANSQNFCLIDKYKKMYLLKRIKKPNDERKLEEQFKIQDWCSTRLKIVPKILKNREQKITLHKNFFIWI